MVSIGYSLKSPVTEQVTTEADVVATVVEKIAKENNSSGGSSTEQVVVEVDVVATTMEDVVEEDNNSGRSRTQRIRKRPSWMKDYVI